MKRLFGAVAVLVIISARHDGVLAGPPDPILLQQAKLIASDGAEDNRFGESVAISGDTAVVGADHGGNSEGAAYVYLRSGGLWTEQQKLTAGDPGPFDEFGTAVAISGDTIMVGAPEDDDVGSNAGSIYVFVRSANTWTQQQKLFAADGIDQNRFGFSVRISGDTAIVGTDPLLSGQSNCVGAAYVFIRTAGVWVQQQKLQASSTPPCDGFGWAVGVSGDTAVVGSTGDDTLAQGSGAAYVFVRSGGVWTEQQKIIASDGAFADTFGYAVAISGETILVGAPFKNLAGAGSGAAYAFVRTNGVWTQQQEVVSDDLEAFDVFGWSVDLLGDIAVIGAPGDEMIQGQIGSALGAVYTFARSGTVWTEQQKLTASDASPFDELGGSVSISGDTVVAGAEFSSDTFTFAGAAYVFAPDTTPPAITEVIPTSSVLWPPDHKMVPVTLTVSATDNSGETPACGITAISSNEPVDGPADGNTTPDWEMTGPLTANLRAERSGEGSGRIYTITVTCVDGSANTTTATVKVTVPH